MSDLHFQMSSEKIDKTYVRGVELCVPIEKWDKQFKSNLTQFKQMNTLDENEVINIKRKDSHEALNVLNLRSTDIWNLMIKLYTTVFLNV